MCRSRTLGETGLRPPQGAFVCHTRVHRAGAMHGCLQMMWAVLSGRMSSPVASPWGSCSLRVPPASCCREGDRPRQDVGRSYPHASPGRPLNLLDTCKSRTIPPYGGGPAPGNCITAKDARRTVTGPSHRQHKCLVIDSFVIIATVMYHPQSEWFDEGPRGGQHTLGRKGPEGPSASSARG
jgi:hypothetical protein